MEISIWTRVVCFGLGAGFDGTGRSAAALPPLERLAGIPFVDVTVTDRFWSPRRETNRLA